MRPKGFCCCCAQIEWRKTLWVWVFNMLMSCHDEPFCISSLRSHHACYSTQTILIWQAHFLTIMIPAKNRRRIATIPFEICCCTSVRSMIKKRGSCIAGIKIKVKKQPEETPQPTADRFVCSSICKSFCWRNRDATKSTLRGIAQVEMVIKTIQISCLCPITDWLFSIQMALIPIAITRQQMTKPLNTPRKKGDFLICLAIIRITPYTPAL